MRSIKLFIVFAFVALLLITGCERKVTTGDDGNSGNNIAGNAAYIGTDACQACHADIHASFVKTGHPFKVNEAADAFTPGYYPFTTLPATSPEIDLSQAAMVIGGFRWKARFIDSSGYIMTGDQVQYNFGNQSWTAYHSGETKPYACGPCHMTNYKAEGNQKDWPGLVGTWEFNGIQCEECHGPGELHAGDPYEIGMEVNLANGKDGCGKCHIRGDENKIPAKGGFVKHHEQWNEMFGSKHASIKCVDCHNVHESLHPLNPNKENAIKQGCESCHLKETASFEASSIKHAGSSVGPSCIDCHMPKAAKSAIANGTYEGDVRSHMFAINTAVDAEMFTPDGLFANGNLTLEYTCLTCHDSKDKAWAANYANAVHAGSPSEVTQYVGSEACAACHQTTYDSFMLTGHPFKINEAKDAFTPGYYPFTTLPTSSPEIDLSQAAMVIGGFRWKARFIDSSGFIMTGNQVQYNFGNDTWTAYHAGETKPYACGPCHMTGYKDVGNQKGLPGLIGTWEFNGVQCEECHGPGQNHINDAYNVDMTVDYTSEACGKCHIRGDVNKIPAKGGFIKHHEQWNEMFSSKHQALQCVDCHDPHVGLHPDNPARATAIKINCENCHFNEAATFANTPITEHVSNGLTCIDCHMPRAAKSAIAVGTYEGDIRSHLFGINVDSTAEMFTTDGAFANGYLTLEYTCLQCHTDPTDTKGWAGQNVKNSHGPMPVKKDNNTFISDN